MMYNNPTARLKNPAKGKWRCQVVDQTEDEYQEDDNKKLSFIAPCFRVLMS